MPDLDTQAVIDALLDWAQEVINAAPGLNDLEGSYDHDTGAKVQGLPDVAGECLEEEVAVRSPLFPAWDFQQVHIQLWQCELAFNANLTDPDDPAAQQAAAHELRSFRNVLIAEKAKDATLGGRVPAVSIFHRIRYRPGYVEFEDGTRVRQMVLAVTVGEPVKVVF